MVIVNKQNYLEQSNQLIRSLPTAAFVTLDLELTGIEIPSTSRPNKFEQPPERYEQLKNVPERYSIIQCGICIFHANPEFGRHARRVAKDYRNELREVRERRKRERAAAAEAAAARNLEGEDGNNEHGHGHAEDGDDRNLEEDGDGDGDGSGDDLGDSDDEHDDEHDFGGEEQNEEDNDNERDAEEDALMRRLENAMPRADAGNGGGNYNHGEDENDNHPVGNANDENSTSDIHYSSNESDHHNHGSDIDSDDDGHRENRLDENREDEVDEIEAMLNLAIGGAGRIRDARARARARARAHLRHQNHIHHRHRHPHPHPNRRRNRDNHAAAHNQDHNRNPNRNPPRAHERMRNEPPEFLVQKYNFYLFPSPNTINTSPPDSRNGMHPHSAMNHGLDGTNIPTREIVMNPSSIKFLNNHDMDFNEWIANGIPYTTLHQAEGLLRQFREEYANDSDDDDGEEEDDDDDDDEFEEDDSSEEDIDDGCRDSDGNEKIVVTCASKLKQDGRKSKSTSKQRKRKRRKAEKYKKPPTPEWTEPTDPQDIAFIAREMANLREWIDSAANPTHVRRRLGDDLSLAEEERLGIVKVVRMPKKESTRACLKGKIEFEYPSLYWDKPFSGSPYANVNGGTGFVNGHGHIGGINIGNSGDQILVRLNDGEKKIRDARRKKYAWRRMLSDKIGFARVFKALSDACRGELGHTGDLDSEYKSFLDRSKGRGWDSKHGLNAYERKIEKFRYGNKKDLDSLNFVDVSCLNPTRRSSSTKTRITEEELTNAPLNGEKRRRVPIIVHNGFMDFLFLLSHFHHHKLPTKYTDAKQLIRSYFPVVYDTKVLATECNDLSIRSKHSSLSQLYQRHVTGEAFLDDNEGILFHREDAPRLRIVNGGTPLATHPHEAGDDAFMIGAVFQCLCRIIKLRRIDTTTKNSEFRNRLAEMLRRTSEARLASNRVGSLLFLDEYHPESKSSAPLYGINKIFMHQSIFTVDLEAEYDPLRPDYRMSSIFRVSHPSRNVTLEDINNIIKNVKDPESAGRSHGQKVQYEIGLTARWFIVAARIRPPRGVHVIDHNVAADYVSTLERRSALLLISLQKHFPHPNDEITSLEDVLIESKVSWSTVKRGVKKKRDLNEEDGDVKEEEDGKQTGAVSRLLNAIGIGSHKRKSDTSKALSVSKRMRNGIPLP